MQKKSIGYSTITLWCFLSSTWVSMLLLLIMDRLVPTLLKKPYNSFCIFAVYG